VKQDEIINGFVQLGKLMHSLGEEKEWSDFSIGVTQEEYTSLQLIVNRQVSYNGWFTKDNVSNSLTEIGKELKYNKLNDFLLKYSFSITPKRVALIMAGNIPLVGFHDFLYVLLSGHSVICKLSSDDKTLLPALAKHLIDFVPELKERIVFTTGRIGVIDAVIATGSDNSLTYFEQYFGKYPHIFRKNRTSVAVFNGDETFEEIKALGKDIFSYFGLGCRNVSHLILPSGFELNRFFEAIVEFGDIVNNNKYGNNYDYNKAVYLLNQHELLDNNFVLLKESRDLFSPLSMIHYHFYDKKSDVESYLKDNKDKIQVIVGEDYDAFGSAQCPALNDFADGVDVVKFLEGI
tara:strand:+ start:19224 stop:20267 length:1044 start_codon:yes stop_codon:yes gene_type:complete